MKKNILQTLVAVSVMVSIGGQTAFAGVGYQGDLKTQFTGETYSDIQNKCSDETSLEPTFTQFKSILSNKTAVNIDGKPVQGDLSYNKFFSQIDMTELLGSFGIDLWMNRGPIIEKYEGEERYNFAYFYDMADVISLFGKDRFHTYLLAKYNKANVEKLPISAGIKDGCGFLFSAGTKYPGNRKTILSSDGKNPLAKEDKIYLSATENGIYGHISYLKLNAVDDLTIGYTDMANPKTNVILYIDYDNQKITFGNIPSKLSSLVIVSEDGTSLVKVYNQTDAKKTIQLIKEDFIKLVNTPITVSINGKKQTADLVGGKSILSKYGEAEVDTNNLDLNALVAPKTYSKQAINLNTQLTNLIATKTGGDAKKIKKLNEIVKKNLGIKAQKEQNPKRKAIYEEIIELLGM